MSDAVKLVDELVAKAKKASVAMAKMTQVQVDTICDALCKAGMENAEKLAVMAYEETGMGNVPDKTWKNNFCSEGIHNYQKDKISVGVFEDKNGIACIAEPWGVIAALIPTTHPTATIIYKSLMAMKTRNVIIFGFHPRAPKCGAAASLAMYNAAVSAGAPQDCIQWIAEPSMESTNILLKHSGVSLVLATGGGAMVKAAYSSGHPALGVGPGNVPVYIEKTADLEGAVPYIFASKLFDNGVTCAAESTVIFDNKDTAEKALEVFKKNGAHILNNQEKEKLLAVMFDKEKGVPSMEIVGKPVQGIAKLAGISVPETAKVLMIEASAIGPADWSSHEKLSPVLAWYVADGKDKAIQAAIDQMEFGGAGHNAIIYSKDEAIVNEFAFAVPSTKVIWNQPSNQAVIGITSEMPPCFALGCGARGGNIFSEVLTYKNLINVKRLIRKTKDLPK